MDGQHPPARKGSRTTGRGAALAGLSTASPREQCAAESDRRPERQARRPTPLPQHTRATHTQSSLTPRAATEGVRVTGLCRGAVAGNHAIAALIGVSVCVVLPDEHDSMSGVACRRAEITLLQPLHHADTHTIIEHMEHTSTLVISTDTDDYCRGECVVPLHRPLCATRTGLPCSGCGKADCASPQTNSDAQSQRVRGSHRRLAHRLLTMLKNECAVNFGCVSCAVLPALRAASGAKGQKTNPEARFVGFREFCPHRPVRASFVPVAQGVR
jgi:hypothetical protein